MGDTEPDGIIDDLSYNNFSNVNANVRESGVRESDLKEHPILEESPSNQMFMMMLILVLTKTGMVVGNLRFGLICTVPG